jgi:copper chaperone CopZ
MKTSMSCVFFLSILLGLSGVVYAFDVAVTVSDVHICCRACERGIQGAVDLAEGVSAEIDADAGVVELTAPDGTAAQRAIDLISEAGFHGSVSRGEVRFKDDSGAPEGTVKRVKVKGIHNCCAGCADAIRDAVDQVEGVEEYAINKKATSFEVSGDFSARSLVKALNAAGFHIQVAH